MIMKIKMIMKIVEKGFVPITKEQALTFDLKNKNIRGGAGGMQLKNGLYKASSKMYYVIFDNIIYEKENIINIIKK